MWKIKKTLLEDLMESSKKYYPDEFMCFLAGNAKTSTVTEVVLLPNTSGNNFASIQESVIPIDNDIIGSVHSHPTGLAQPSNADKKFFNRYELNLIISIKNNHINFFDSKGNLLSVKTK
jgi:proteasome lid subunit RPN8/RPN11